MLLLPTVCWWVAYKGMSRSSRKRFRSIRRVEFREKKRPRKVLVARRVRCFWFLFSQYFVVFTRPEGVSKCSVGVVFVRSTHSKEAIRSPPGKLGRELERHIVERERYRDGRVEKKVKGYPSIYLLNSPVPSVFVGSMRRDPFTGRL